MGKIRNSIYDLEQRTGMRAAHISKILKGRGVSLAGAIRLSKAMGKSLDGFVKDHYPHLLNQGARSPKQPWL